MTQNIRFGGGYKSSFNESYKKAKESINLLSFGSSEESIMRLDSTSIVGELMSVMRNEGERSSVIGVMI